MKATSLVLELIYNVVMIGLGSYGSYILFNEFVEMEQFRSISQFLLVIRKRWYALLALTIAIVLFFYPFSKG
ncbi:MAG: hypothetical protein ACYC6R_11265 [Anaerolineales bacterium]